ncbi:MAG: bestrophin family ion channel [Bacteroidota bacterium]|nr:bestrophin family ion channel [Bacteroidota bacterium]
MHAGKRFTLKEFILWTRRDIYKLFFLTLIPTSLFHFFDFTFLSIAWVPIALLGTAVAFIVGFKNNASYARVWEARTIYGGIINSSRAFAVMVRDYLPKENSDEIKVIFYRHFAWLTALRYQLREPRIWENMNLKANVEYLEHVFKIPERETKLEDELSKYLSDEEKTYILSKKNRATQLMAQQSKHLKKLFEEKKIDGYQYQLLQNALTSFYDFQGRAERIKNFPYPRNFSSVTTILLNIFIVLVPFGLLNEFDKLGTNSILDGYTVWFNVPFGLLITWVFKGLDSVGESSMNPFEGNANDVPISNISRTIEIDMREMLDEKDLPEAITPINNILM